MKTILLPFLLSFSLAYILNPLVQMIQRLGVRRFVSVAAVYLVLGGCSLLAVYVVCAEGASVLGKLSIGMPSYLKRLNDLFDVVKTLPIIHQLGFESGLSRFQDQLDQRLFLFWQQLPTLAVVLLPLLELAVLVPLITFFIMLEGSSIRMGIIQLMPGRSVERLLSIFVEIDTTLGDYLRGLCLEGMFVGGLMGISFFFIGLEYVFPLTVLAIVSVLIPFVGPLCVGALAAICALIQWGTWTGLLKVVAICLVVRFLDDSILQPVIMRRAVQMHPVTTIFTLMLGGTLAGTWGLLFAVPTFCIIKVLVRAGWDWYRSESGFSRSGFVRAVNIPPLI